MAQGGACFAGEVYAQLAVGCASVAAAGAAVGPPTPTPTPTPNVSVLAPAAGQAVGPPTLDVSVLAPAAGQVIGVEGVTFTWTQVAGATGYDLRIVNPATQAVLFSGSLVGETSTSTIISLPSNGTYTFTVRACVGGFSDATCGTFAARTFSVALVSPGAAPTVTAPAAGAQLTQSRQTIAWTTVAGNPALPDLFYEVRLLDLVTGQTELALRTFHPVAQTPAVLRSGNYRVQVRACQAGCGPYSAAVDFTVALGPVPSAAPTVLSAMVSGGNSLSASWTAVAGGEWYQVQVVQPPPAGPGGGALTVASRQVSGATNVAGLPVPTGQAFVIVAACNGDGCGPYSGGASINPTGPNPSAPHIGAPIVDAVVSGPSVLFAWNRIPGDTGNTLYRVYVQDLSRQTAALDVLTTQNYYGALLKAEGAKYAVLVIANPGQPNEVQGPGAAFTVRGSSAVAPTLIAPTHESTVAPGNVLFAWSPVPGATLYEYYVAVQGVSAATGRGVTQGLFVQVPLAAVGGEATVYSGIARACPAGATCVAGNDAGWGPWSNVAGTGGINVTVLARGGAGRRLAALLRHRQRRHRPGEDPARRTGAAGRRRRRLHARVLDEDRQRQRQRRVRGGRRQLDQRQHHRSTAMCTATATSATTGSRCSAPADGWRSASTGWAPAPTICGTANVANGAWHHVAVDAQQPRRARCASSSTASSTALPAPVRPAM